MQRAIAAIAGGADRYAAAQRRMDIHAVIFGARHELVGEHDVVRQRAMRQGVPEGPFIEDGIVDDGALVVCRQHAPHPKAPE